MSSTDTSLTIVNSMTESYLESLKDSSGKVPSLANQLIMTDDEEEGGGSGSSVDIDNSSITKNSSDQIQTVGVIDQNTGNANKQWTGTLAEYNALGTHDANTFYNITDDNANAGLIVDTLWSGNKTTTGSLSLNSNINDYKLFVFNLNETNVNEAFTCIISIDTINYAYSNNIAFVTSVPNDSVNKYITYKKTSNTSFNIQAINYMRLLSIKGIK